jgi:hypothetical protein
VVQQRKSRKVFTSVAEEAAAERMKLTEDPMIRPAENGQNPD